MPPKKQPSATGHSHPWLSGTKLYLLIGAGGLVSFISFSLVVTWLAQSLVPAQTATREVIAVEEAPAEVSASQAIEAPSVEVLRESPYAEVVKQAAMKAESAQNITQSALSSSDWEVVVIRWREALQLIELVPESDELYEKAQQDKETYSIALSYAQQGKAVPAASELFRQAINVATQAAQLAQTADSSYSWRQVAKEWEESIRLMKGVPPSSSDYAVAQQKATEYEKNRVYAQANADKPIAVASTPITTPQPATTGTRSVQARSSRSGSCDCPYDTDSAGRSCGGRSAYSRPGGSSPICYKTVEE